MKRLISLFLIAVLALSFSVSALAYTDTTSAAVNQWGYLLASDASGAFNPDGAVTRAEFAHVVNALAKYPTSTSTFLDVPADHKYAGDIGALQKAGVVEGSVKGVQFDPENPLTRQEAAKMLGLAFGLPQSSSTTSFADDADIAAWAKPYVESLKAFSYLSGRGNNDFDPKANLTRSEICQIAFNVNPGKQADKANYIVTSAGTIKDKEFNNLIIASNVTGTVTLENVKVNGSVVVLGENGKATADYANTGIAKSENLVSLNGKSNIETYASALSIIVKGTSNIAQMFVQTVASVQIDATVGLFVVQQSAVSVTVGATASVSTMVVTEFSLAVEVTNNGKITEIDVYSKDTVVANNGVIEVAVHYSVVVIEGVPDAPTGAPEVDEEILLDDDSRGGDPYSR